jgi:hypothetical protein
MPQVRPSFLPPPRDKRQEKSGFVYPGKEDRVTINGMTGSGKSTFALWLFAESADFNKKPWVLIDFKGEKIIQQMQAEKLATTISVKGDIPKQPGVYVVNPHPLKDGMPAVTEFLWKIYSRGKTGLFLDEATMIPELRGEANTGGPFQSILSQGRSKEIPCWVLAQRPAFVNNMVYTENNYYCAFVLRSPKDLAKVRDNIRTDSGEFERVWGDDTKLPKHCSRWYDVEQNKSWILRPSPPADTTLDILYDRLDKMKKREAI